MFTHSEMEQAHSVVATAMRPTPEYCWPGLCRRAGCEVWLKHENHTPTGAFKVRGGLVYLDELKRGGGLPPRLATATRGNHGQSIPFAARRHGLKTTVFVPHGNSAEKNAAMIGWGAELVEFGHDFDAAREECERRAAQEGALLVPSFHPALVRGVATYAMELFAAVADLRTVYVPIGMGSGICGLIGARDLLGLKTEIVGVVAAEAPAMARSWAAGRIVETNTAQTFADGMACRVPMPEPLAVIRAGAERIVEVSEDEIADAMRAIYAETHNVAEGAGAAAFAALLQERERQAGKRVAAILTGGNVDAEVFRAVLGGESPRPAAATGTAPTSPA